ncbi:MAG: hypothetical protein QM500_09705 [Methylococcales bacterium]
MTMKQLLHVVLLFLLLMPSLQAQGIHIIEDNQNTLTLQTTTKYVLSDNDSIIDARAIALQQAKKIAAEKAGSYIHAEKVIVNNKIKSDTIDIVSTALMSIEISKESVKIVSGNKTQLSLTVIAKINKESLYEKLGSLKDNKDKQQKIDVLEKENKRLVAQLARLNTRLLGGEKKNNSLVAQRDNILAKITNNESAVRKIFQPGLFLTIANKNSDAFSNEKNNIDQYIFQYIINETQIDFGEPAITKNDDGTYNARFPIVWKIDSDIIKSELSKHFVLSKKGDNMSQVVRSDNVSATSYPNREKLFDYYNGKYLYIEITAGKYKAKRMIMGSYNATSSEYAISSYDDQSIKLSNKNTQDIIIKNIPEKDLSTMKTLSAKIRMNSKTIKHLKGKKRAIYTKLMHIKPPWL